MISTIGNHDRTGSTHSVLRDEQPGESGLLLPMLLDGGVDLYLCGHLHALNPKLSGKDNDEQA